MNTVQRESNPDNNISSQDQQKFWTTKKNPASENKLYRGGLSQEIDIFYVGKRRFQERKDLYKSKFQIQ